MNFKTFTPMSPLRTEKIPSGNEWTHQLKWDGYRALSFVEPDRISLYSKSMNDMSHHYPEIIQALAKLPFPLVADGELVIMDPKTMRPSFQMLQNRSKRKEGGYVQYIVFDLLMLDGQDLRQLEFVNRHRSLENISRHFDSSLFLTDLWENGDALWQWVEEHGWEGIVSKRLNSVYSEGKKHRDWYKKKSSIILEADVVGFLYRGGRLASLVLRREGRDFGRVSLGLTQSIKSELAKFPIREVTPIHSNRQEKVHWLQTTLSAHVMGSEITDQGFLRHPKLYKLEGVHL